MSDSCVELVTFEQLLRRYPQLEQHRIAPTGGAFCRAERLKGLSLIHISEPTRP